MTCPPTFLTLGPVLTLLQAELEKRGRSTYEQGEQRKYLLLQEHLPWSACVHGCRLKDTFISVQIYTFKPQGLNG